MGFYQLGKPSFECQSWLPETEGFVSIIKEPISFMSEQPFFKMVLIDGEKVIINFDIFGLTYWCLSRAEEVDRTDLDEHDRFSTKSSHAYQHSCLERPVVDEWFDILGQAMLKIEPSINLKHNSFSIKLSHDVMRQASLVLSI